MILKSTKNSLLGLAVMLAIVFQAGTGFAQTSTSTATSTATTTNNTSTSTTGTFVLEDSQVSNPNVNEGSSVTVDAMVKSQNATTSNAIVEMTFLNESNEIQGTTTTISNKDFPADQSVTLTATSPTNLVPGTYHVALSIFSNDRSEKFITFDNVINFAVSATSTDNGGGNGTSTASTTPTIPSVDTSNIGSTAGMIIFNLSGLTPATNYTFIGSLWDAANNLLVSSQKGFTSASGSDGNGSTSTSTQNLSISSVSGTSNQDGTSATITWTTNQNANTQVMYGTSSSYTASSNLDSGLVMSHSVNLTGLTPSTQYHFQVMSTTASGTVATSSDQTFTTDTVNDGGNGGGGTSSLSVSSVAASSAQDGTSATITWTTNQNANTQVMYGTSSSYTASSSLDTNLVTNHSVNLSGLTPGTVYHFQVVSIDSSGDSAVSPDKIFTTVGTNPTPPVTNVDALQLRITQLQEQVIALLQQQLQNLINNINNRRNGNNFNNK